MATESGHIQAGPFLLPVEFVRWLVAQAALFVVLLIILWQVQTDVLAILASEQTIINNETRIIGDNQQLLGNQDLTLRYCNVTPLKGGP